MDININAKGSKAITKAIAEVFSPVTESLGLIGDQVRIYRELTLLRTLKRAQETIKNEKLKVEVPKVKFLVPYLENCSLEDPNDDSLIDMWANLLVSSSIDIDLQHPVFVRILKDITSSEAEVLSYVASKDRPNYSGNQSALEDAELEWKDTYIYIALRDLIRSTGGVLGENFDFADLERRLRSNIEGPGSIIYHFDVAVGQKNTYPLQDVHVPEGRHPIDDFESISIAALESLGLLNNYISKEIWFAPYVFEVRAYYMTQLGAKFYNACKLITD